MSDSTPQQVPPGHPPLRVALLHGEAGAPAWLVRSLTALAQSGVIHVAGAISLRGVHAGEPWTFGRYLRADWRKHRRDPDPLEVVAVSGVVGQVPSIQVQLPRPSTPQALPAEAVQFLSDLRPDLIISSLAARLDDRVAQAAALGAWRVCLDVIDGTSITPDGFWSMAAERPVTTIEIRGQGAGGDVTVSSLHTATDFFSMYRGRATRAVAAGRMLRQELARLHVERRLPSPGPPAPRQADVVRMPSTPDVLRWKLRSFLPRLWQSYLDRSHWPEWSVAYHVRPAADSEPAMDLGAFRVLPSPAGTYQADPCVVVHDGRHLMFVEDYVHSMQRGHIAVVEFDDAGNPGPLRPVLERPYHLSYPCVFRWQGAWYMIPESMERGAVELYRATSFPDQWELDRVLLEGVRACDATIHQQGNDWWMFVALAEDGAPAIDELHLYHAPAPTGPWVPAPGNPVKRDVRGARPAGRLMRMRGQWVRPGQDSALGYGHFIRFFEVTHLTAERYEEVEAGRLGPDPSRGMERVHTISHAGRVTAIDLFRVRPRWS